MTDSGFRAAVVMFLAAIFIATVVAMFVPARVTVDIPVPTTANPFRTGEPIK